MGKRQLGLIALLLSTCLATGPEAFSKGKSKDKEVSRNHSIWFGGNAGMMHIVSEQEQEEASKNGYSLGARGAYSIYGEDKVLDLGIGYKQARVKRVSDISDNQTEELEVVSGFGHADFSYRWRFGNDELGPKLMATFGGDSSFSKDPEPNNKANAWIGVSWNRTHLSDSSSPSRYGLEFITDVSIHDRQPYWVNFHYEVGVPLIKPDKKIVKVVKVKNKVVKKVVVKEVVKEKILYRERIVVDAGFVNPRFRRSVHINDIERLET